MPLYEYQCQECGEKTEVVQRFDDAPLSICASCGGALKKLISAPAIQFKGSGFYLTDYGRSGSSAATKSSTSETPTASEPSKPSAPPKAD
ncbi:MAG: zinc ribbon domain-containing protein [Acidobacteria bacterium]|nr:zinc ribbon domain-containing protein [Acidobacteriota bacterium]